MQYVSIKYTERLAKAGVEPSVGSVGDSYKVRSAVLDGEAVILDPPECRRQMANRSCLAACLKICLASSSPPRNRTRGVVRARSSFIRASGHGSRAQRPDI